MWEEKYGDGYLSKPCTPEELIIATVEILKRFSRPVPSGIEDLYRSMGMV
jgi:hypothetical protein